MKATLEQFTSGNLFDSSYLLLKKLQIPHTMEVSAPIRYEDYYENTVPAYVQNALSLSNYCYYLGEVSDDAIQGFDKGDTPLSEDLKKLQDNVHYRSMMIFAVDIKPEAHITRTILATLTRAFNRLVYNFPVTVIFRQGHLLSIATCERTEYQQEWRQGQGEKLGKVSMLRDINCLHPHRGHLMILDTIYDKLYPTFDELYKHWMEVFSSQLLTRKFYEELSDWYAWAVQVARFPNDLTTNEDDDRFNHESCIRLITRLIFVWFIKQKHLVPEEFFDESYIRDHYIENFDPHDRQTLLYNAEDSKYYRLILQNLFFAMFNCPIVAEGKNTPNNRRFRGDGQIGYKRDGYNINNLMRYKNEFREGGADEFVRMANSHVPFLNGGLFDCLDDKPKNLYYDGFSERKESLEQLYMPDWLFFGDEVGRSVDLSQWYGDAKKKKVCARGIIDILKRYNFTIEENTPLDQEVSLDPELLGKAFENLLASYNPETKTSARKQTGSFYTPREIVQYMVDESLVAHLKRTCGEELEAEYRSLLSYSTDETSLNVDQRKAVMHALYNCHVLDPACGSGAFPMGVLQQMVHLLQKLDSSNEMWKDFMIDIAIEKSRKAYSEEAEEERKARLADIEEAFDRSINDPDYARKLYLIEHCIYGVDIQPIAVQISKLRFFISLVVDQNPSEDATNNFGIRPLPNLESKFVTANTLVHIDYDPSIVEESKDVINNKKQLKELNHQIFLAKRNIDKQRLKDKITNTRHALAKAIEETGFIGHSEAEILSGWDMFDQNASSSFFDAEWMFDIKDGFDIIIANPPYKIVPREDVLKPYFDSNYFVARGGKRNLYHLFFERGIKLAKKEGVLTYITPDTYFSGNDTIALREFFVKNVDIRSIVHFTEKEKVFENVTQAVAVIVLVKQHHGKGFNIISKSSVSYIDFTNVSKKTMYLFKASDPIVDKMNKCSQTFDSICEGYKGDVNLGLKKNFFTNIQEKDCLPLVRGIQLLQYTYNPGSEYCSVRALSKNHTSKERIVFQEVSNMGLAQRIKGTILKNVICGDTCNVMFSIDRLIDNKTILSILNSKPVNYYFKFFNQTNHVPIGEIKKIPFPQIAEGTNHQLVELVNKILNSKKFDALADTTLVEQQIDRIVCHLYDLSYDEVLIIDPETQITREEYERNQ